MADNTPKRLQDIVREINEPGSTREEGERFRHEVSKPPAPGTQKTKLDKNLEVRIERLKAGVEGGGSYSKPLDASRVDFGKYTDKNIKVIGEVYQSSSGLLNGIFKFFTALPVSSQLRSSLKCAGIKIDAETYVAIISTLSFTGAAFMMLLFSSVGITAGALNIGDIFSTSLLIIVVGLFTFMLIGLVGLAYPNMAGRNRAIEMDRELPFALRHLATQMSAGVSFQHALSSVSDADYGILSEELKYAIARMDSGLSTEDALLELGERTYSTGLKQAVIQIVRALRTGGKISEIITSIADDVAFETRMRVRDFTEALNLISIVFIMVAVVAPVVATIMTAILQLPYLGGGVSPILVIVIFSGLVLGMISILVIIKELEPMAV